MESSVAPRVIFQRGNVCTEHSLLKTRQQWRDFDTKPHTTKLRLKLQLRLPQKRSQRPTGVVRNLLINMGEVICLADPGHPALQRRAMLQQPACCYASLAFFLSFSPCCKNLPLRIAPFCLGSLDDTQTELSFVRLHNHLKQEKLTRGVLSTLGEQL